MFLIKKMIELETKKRITLEELKKIIDDINNMNLNLIINDSSIKFSSIK